MTEQDEQLLALAELERLYSKWGKLTLLASLQAIDSLTADLAAANERIAWLEGVVDAVICARETKRKAARYNAPSRDVAEAMVAEAALVVALAALSAIAPSPNTAGPQE